MKKVLLCMIVFMLIFTVSCKKADEPQVLPDVSDEGKAKAPEQEIPKVETTGNPAIDEVGSNINEAETVEEDLSADELDDLDSILDDIENIQV